jgi:hypothetical protein
VIERVLDELRCELAQVGVTGTAAFRPVAEAREHLLEGARDGDEEAAVAAFGSPQMVAGRLAAEIASQRTCGAAFASFAALALTAGAYLLIIGLGGAAGAAPDVTSGRTAVLGIAAAAGMILLPQVAFVAGCLAALQAWRIRRRPTVAAELALLRRRSAVALTAGAASAAALALYAFELGSHLAGWWMPLAIALCAAAVVALTTAAVRLRGSAQIVAPAQGPAGDVFDDLSALLDRVAFVRPERLRARAAAVVAGAAVLICFATVAARWRAEGDPGSGLAAGALETIAFVACYFALRRPLALGELRVKEARASS